MAKYSKWSLIIIFAFLAPCNVAWSQTQIVSAEECAMVDEGFGPLIAFFKGGGRHQPAISASLTGAGAGSGPEAMGAQNAIHAENNAQVTFGELKRAYVTGEQ
jgi:hypothetical protein